MENNSPPTDKNEKKQRSDKLIEIRCPYCADAGRNAILGKVLKRRVNLLVQNAVQGDGLDAILDLIYYCRHCEINFVYGVIAV